MSLKKDDKILTDLKTMEPTRSNKEKKKVTRSRSRVRQQKEDTEIVDPDYSPVEEVEIGSEEVSSSSASIVEKLSSNESTPVPTVLPCSGTICALCYCGEKSLLGQGDLTRYDPTPGFHSFRKPGLKTRNSKDSFAGQSPVAEYGDRSSKSPVRSRSRETRHSRDSNSRQSDIRNVEVAEELSMLGCAEIADPHQVFESTGHVTAHHCCAAWSEGVTQNELYQLLSVDKAVHSSISQKCSYCNRYGATIKCKASRCDKIYHYPCAAGSGCFQDIKSMLLLCSDHLEQAPSIAEPDELNCAVCDDMGEISNFLFCTSCGHHYHGNCLQLFVEVNPVVRAGWQCPDCKICQTCRQPGDDNKMLVCDCCDKGYHTYCLQPAMSFIPKNGWSCQNCRRCADCGSKKPATNPEAQGDSSYQICDDCYEQRNQGSSCPVCDKAYNGNINHEDMMRCNECKKWVHEECEDVIDMSTYYDMGTDYFCPHCRNEIEEVEPESDNPADVDFQPVDEGSMEFGPVGAGDEEPESSKEEKSIVKEEEKMLEVVDKKEIEEVVDKVEPSKPVVVPAKRNVESTSSIESHNSSSAMKGSSTDPMLYSNESQIAVKQRIASDESTIRHTAMDNRKPSIDSHLMEGVFEDSNTQDPLGLFSGDAFQPIVSIPMFDESLSKESVEWLRRKPRRLSALSDSRSPTKPIEVSPRESMEMTSPLRSPSQGLGKPGPIFGKGKPFGARKKPGSAKRGKGCSRGKGRGGRRPRPSSGAYIPPSNVNLNTNVPSPGSTVVTSNQLGANLPGTLRRRSRSRLRTNAGEVVLGALTGMEHTHDTVDEEYGDSMHNTVVLCSADDDFTLNQDMCVVCGSFGKGAEGRLVACSQCGQCYHPYCVNLKLTKVVLRKGWRCLDCTVCEECGAPDDPAHLLLCDDCDVSYHTYCLKPPLLHVPKGGWKCKWCVRCTHCGSTSPGVNSDWAENYTSCGPCASLSHCPLCRKGYRDEEIMMQCGHCERWLHSSCEYLYVEMDIEKVLEKGYNCALCRPKGTLPPHLDLNPPQAYEGDPSSGIYLGRTRSDVDAVKEYHKDGVALTTAGLQHIQQLMQNAMALHKKKPGIQKRKSHLNKHGGKPLASPESKVKLPSMSALLDKPPDLLADHQKSDIICPGGKDPLAVTGLAQLLKPNLEDGELPSQVSSIETTEGGDGFEGEQSNIELGFSNDVTKQALMGVQQGGVKRRRKPYRPGIGGFNVRQRGGRTGFMGTRGRRGRFGSSLASSSTIAKAFDPNMMKTEDVKQMTGGSAAGFTQGNVGGLALNSAQGQSGMTDLNSSDKSEGQTSVLVSPLKLKISTHASTGVKPKKKKRFRLLDQFPPYIQEGFFGTSVLVHARTTKKSAIEGFEETADKENKEIKTDKPASLSASQIILPERVRLRLEAQIAQKANEARKKAELKQERLHARRLPSGDDDPLDKESEQDLLGALPAELLGILSGGLKQGQGGHGSHSILSPSALETLVTDGLANIDDDLFSEVLNTHDATTSNDDHALLSDITSLSEQSKHPSTNDSLNVSSIDVTSSTAYELDQTNAILDQMTAEENNSQQNMMINNQPIKTENVQQTQIQQQQFQGQLQQQQMQQQQQHSEFSQQQQIRIFEGTEQTSSPGQIPINPQQQQQQVLQQQQQGKMLQQQQSFIDPINQGNLPSNNNMSGIIGQVQDPLLSTHHHQDLLMRQQSMPEMQQTRMMNQPRVMTPGGNNIFGPSVQQPMLNRSASVSGGSQPPSMTHSPVMMNVMENQAVKGQQPTVNVLPDFSSDKNLFEPAAPPWPLGTDLEGDCLTVNQRNILKWEKDEPLGDLATISPVLYANMKHGYLKKDFPDWQNRAKQVAKLWRKATSEERAPFLQKARDNRAYLKSTRRDIDLEPSPNELPDHDTIPMSNSPNIQQKQPILSASDVDSQLMASSQVNMSLPQQQQQQQQQMQFQQQQQHNMQMMRNSTQSPGANLNFAKPRPLSREHTPKPVSPGAANISINRSKSPFASAPTSPMSGVRPRSQWGDIQQQPINQIQTQNIPRQQQQQQMMMGMQPWQQNQPSGVRIPKMEAMESGMSHAVRFPQSYPQNVNSPGKAPLQRRGSMLDVSGVGGDQFGRVNPPRPGMPPQLLPQAQSPGYCAPSPHSLTPVSSQMRSQTPVQVMQPTTPQPIIRNQYFNQGETGESFHGMHGLQAGQMVPQLPGPQLISKTGGIKIEPQDKMFVCQPQIREILRHKTDKRRYKLHDQQPGVAVGSWPAQVVPSPNNVTRPPPPYPSQSPILQSPTSGSFGYSPRERFANQGPGSMAGMRMQGFRPELATSPTFNPSLPSPVQSQPFFGVERFPGGHPLRMTTPSSSAVVSGVSTSASTVVGAGYIELKHSKQPDPAVRREQIIRAGNLNLNQRSGSTSTEPQPKTSAQATVDIKVTNPVTAGISTAATTTRPNLITTKIEPASTMESQLGAQTPMQTPSVNIQPILKLVKSEPIDANVTNQTKFDVPASSLDVVKEKETSTSIAENKERIEDNVTISQPEPTAAVVSINNDVDLKATVVAKTSKSVSESNVIITTTSLTQKNFEKTEPITEKVVDKPLLKDDEKMKNVSVLPSLQKKEPVQEILTSSVQEIKSLKTTAKQEPKKSDEKTSPDPEIKSGVEPKPSVKENVNKVFQDQLSPFANVTVASEKQTVDTDTNKKVHSGASVVQSDQAAVEKLLPDQNLSKTKVKVSNVNLKTEKEKSSPDTTTAPVKIVDTHDDKSKTAIEEANKVQNIVHTETTQSKSQSVDNQTVTSAVTLPVTNITTTTPAVINQPIASVASATITGVPNLAKTLTTAVESQPSQIIITAASTMSITPTVVSNANAQIISDISTSNISTSNVIASNMGSDISLPNIAQPQLPPELTNLPDEVTPLTSKIIPPVHPQFPVPPSAQPIANVTPPVVKKERPLLINEQPLLIQDLLDEEKREQERVRQEKLTQAMLQQQQQSIYTGMEADKQFNPDVGIDRIMQAKIKILSGINQVINSSTSNQTVEVQQTPTQFVSHHVSSNPHWTQMPASGQPVGQDQLGTQPFLNEEQRKLRHEEWLFQHQGLLQMQVKTLEQTAKQHKSTKQALTKKQKQSRKSGEEFTSVDVQNLQAINQQQNEILQKLDEARKEQLHHSELVQEYENNKHVSSFTGGQQINHSMSATPMQPHPMHMNQQQQQHITIMRQQSAPCEQIMSPNLQSQPMTITSQPGGANKQITPQNTTMSSPQASGMTTIQPTFTSPGISSTISPKPNVVMSGPIPMTPQQQQQQQQEAIFSHLQKIPGIRQMNPAQIQKLVMQQQQQPGIISITQPNINQPTSATAPVMGAFPMGLQQQQHGAIIKQGPNPQMMGHFDNRHPGQLMQPQMSPDNRFQGIPPGMIRQPGNFPQYMIDRQHHMTMQQQQQITQQEEKPKKKRKKKKKTSTSENPLIPQVVMSHGGQPGMMVTTPQGFMHQHRQLMHQQHHIMNQPNMTGPRMNHPTSMMYNATTMSTTMVGTSSIGGNMVSTPSYFTGPRPLMQPTNMQIATRPTMFTSPTHDISNMPATGMSPTKGKFPNMVPQQTPGGLMVAGTPVPVQSIKKEIKQSPTTAHITHQHNPAVPQTSTPPSIGNLTEAEMEIIKQTDPDVKSPTTEEIARLQSNERSMALINDTIDGVLRDAVDYEKKVQMAHGSGITITPPQWMREAKKYSPKSQTMQMGLMSPKSPHYGFGPGMNPDMKFGPSNQELLRHMLRHGNAQNFPGAGGMNIHGMTPYGGLDKEGIHMSPEQLKKQMELMGSPYQYKEEDLTGGKKKRSRKTSKDPTKKKRRKNKDKEDGRDVAPGGLGFPDNNVGVGMNLKQPNQWKPLALLPLVEPDIKVNYNMCMPKGTGLTISKSLLEGTIGNSTYRGLPDYYDLIQSKDPLSYLDPPTPPNSLPPSPKNIMEDKDQFEMRQVKVPDSLPTPPHHGPEGLEDNMPAIRPFNENDIPPSSPEVDAEEQEQKRLSFDNLPLMRVANIKDDNVVAKMTNAMEIYRHPLSPSLAVIHTPLRDPTDNGDNVSVTVAFKSASSKGIRKYLTQLSRTLDTSIISFKMEDSTKDEAKVKKEIEANEKQAKAEQMLDNYDGLLHHQRRCFYCFKIVEGNGVRKPILDEDSLEEDTLFCNKQCYFNNEFDKKGSSSLPVSKKKWKASQYYQRHTCKINLSSLIEANPEPDHMSTRAQRLMTPGFDLGEDITLRSSEVKGRGRGRRRGSMLPGDESRLTAKRFKGVKWKRWTITMTVVKNQHPRALPDVDVLLSKYGSALKPSSDLVDTRVCVLCSMSGDGDTSGVARLLNLDVDQWVHLNCALWSAEVYETQGGALINVDLAVSHSTSAMCEFCQKKGATLHCNRSRCPNLYHCACALECGCHFFKDKTILCPSHVANQPGMVQHGDQLRSLAVFRKVYVQRQETKQIASIMQQGELTQGEKNYILRVGALMFYAVGQLATHQMAMFHSKTAIYPVGYKATRIYWSSNNTRKRCKFTCTITEKDNKPWFTTKYQTVASRPKTDKLTSFGDLVELAGNNVNGQWFDLLQQLSNLRSQQKMLKLFPSYINGENVFGLTSPVVCRILESLPNIELCANYKSRYGRCPLLELPLAINPTGSARSEPHIKQYRKKPHTLISNLISEYYESTGYGDASSSLYGKHFVHSKSSQYRRMKQEWRNNVYLARSRIQGLGLFASKDIEPGTMVIEYIGEIIRSEIAEKREKQYEAANRGVYMFRLDSDYIVDATVTGGPARYINHSCNPNCVAEVVNFEKEKKIMIISNRHILSGEELNYDYKFDFEDEGNKIPCLCGAINCRKWMN